MKTCLFLILALFGFSFADTPSYTAVDGVYEIELDTAISAGSNFDSLKTSADSSTLCTKWKPDQMWEFFLVVGTITGTSKDSANLKFVADVYDYNDSMLYRVAFDTIVDAAGGEALKIPIGGTLFGKKFTIKVIAINGGTALNVQLNTLEIYKRRARTLMKLY